MATPLLAAAAAEGIDSSSLRFLTASALEARRREEEKEEVKMRALNDRVRHNLRGG